MNLQPQLRKVFRTDYVVDVFDQGQSRCADFIDHEPDSGGDDPDG